VCAPSSLGQVAIHEGNRGEKDFKKQSKGKIAGCYYSSVVVPADLCR